MSIIRPPVPRASSSQIRTSGRLLELLLTLALVCVSGHAVAQDAPESGTAAERFTAGQEAFDRGEYAEALAHFEATEVLAPHPGNRFNIARCLERLGRLREAIDHYRASQLGEVLPLERRQSAELRAAALRADLGEVDVTTTPPNAEVSVDGAVRCTSPCRFLQDPRQIVVVLRLDERTVERAVSVRSGVLSRLVIDLSPPPRPPIVPPMTETEAPIEPVRTPLPPAPTGWAPTWALGVGIAFAVLAVGGAIGFGVRTLELSDRFAMGDFEVADEGALMRDLTNVSIVLFVPAALFVVLDLAWLGRQ